MRDYKFSLVIDDKDIITKLREQNPFARCAFDEKGESTNEWTWIDHVLEMLEFSKSYPDTVFGLILEERWGMEHIIKYFKNGKYYDMPAKIVYDDFNEELLK